MTPDNLDLVPGGAWHDGLTYSPQQGEEAGSVQQHQPACQTVVFSASQYRNKGGTPHN